MGRAMLLIEEGLCDPDRLKLAHLLGVTTD
jgi:hypothetical protein